VPIQKHILSFNTEFDHRFNLLEVLDVAIVFCERALLRLVPVGFRSGVVIVLLLVEFSLFPVVVKSFGVFRADRVRT
jgi:hypothetical protein